MLSSILVSDQAALLICGPPNILDGFWGNWTQFQLDPSSNLRWYSQNSSSGIEKSKALLALYHFPQDKEHFRKRLVWLLLQMRNYSTSDTYDPALPFTLRVNLPKRQRKEIWWHLDSNELSKKLIKKFRQEIEPELGLALPKIKWPRSKFPNLHP